MLHEALPTGWKDRWLGAGRKQLRSAASMGGNVGVGLRTASDRASELQSATPLKPCPLMVEGLGLEVATPADARENLSLKGSSKVAF